MGGGCSSKSRPKKTSKTLSNFCRSSDAPSRRYRREGDIMVRLTPMTATDFQAYLEQDIERYAQERVRVGDWLASEALQKSREEHQQLLPDGLATRKHYLFSIEDEALGLKVGIIWFALYDQQLQPLA